MNNNIIRIYGSNDVPNNYTGMAIFPLNTITFYKQGHLHKEDGPAVIYWNKTVGWYLNGKLSSPYEVFEQMIRELQERALWDLNNWIKKGFDDGSCETKTKFI